jgi:hypothetical protein
MNITIALAQFIMIALGAMASRILVNSGAVSAASVHWTDRAAILVANQGLWFLIIPAVWFFAAESCARLKPAWAGAAQASGVAVTVILLAAIVAMLAF